jgi:2-polyprenyl-3-methyl-5-hydroxy-6-metoxy-1,4-benzoquinol methylase
MLTERQFYQAEVDAGYTTWDFVPLVLLHKKGVDALKALGCETAFEIGSGLGFFLIAANMSDLKATGYDPNKYARNFATTHGAYEAQYKRHEPGEFPETDAVYCVEVMEHIPDAELHRMLNKFRSRFFYFTSTPHPAENDLEWGHINLKTPMQWQAFFSEHGYSLLRYDQAVCPWGMIFENTQRMK